MKLPQISPGFFPYYRETYKSGGSTLKQSAELAVFISDNEQKTNDVETFVEIVRKYEVVTELTPEVMNELIDRIEVHAPDKSSGHRRQTIDIYFRFNVASATAEICNMDYYKLKKAV